MSATTRDAYSTDLTDEQWQLIAPMIPGPTGSGTPITVNRREVVNAILYLLGEGCKWASLPHDFPKEGTVRDYYHQWRRSGLWKRIHDALRDEVRRRAGREVEPSAAVIDSQTVKATRTTGTRGYDAGKKISGRKRHIMVDVMGLLLAVLVHPASIQDRDGAKLLLARARREKRWPRLRVVFADGGYAGKLIEWVWRLWQVALSIVKRSDTALGFEVLPKRWVVERTFGWLGDYRRLSKDYEFHEATSEAMIHVAMIHLMLKRLAPSKGRR